MRIQHPIFRSPNPVQLTIASEPTPATYGREGLGKTMPMWRVQTEGYHDGTDQLIGLVSRDAGFMDSPDVEWISSGVNSKNSSAVAIGRHGNFFLWGFAASPTFLTDEAKLVFANAVHYIAKFDHRAPIARKRQGTMMRSAIASSLERITEAGYRGVQETYRGYIADDQKRRESIKAKAAAGEELSKVERSMLARQAMQVPGRFAPVRRYFSDDEWQKVAGNEQAIRRTLQTRLPYMRSQGWYELVVDEELRQFGVANSDPSLLDKAIAALATKAQGGLARRLLERYTNQSFASPDEWATWLRANREHLFFTESGGYKWLVDTTNANALAEPASSERGAGVAPSGAVADKAVSTSAMQPAAEPNQKHPLVARMRVESSKNDRHQVVVEVQILEGWHAYESLPATSPYTLLEASLQLPAGLKRDGDWQRPAGGPYLSEPELTVYEGEVKLRCELLGALPKGLSGVACTLFYQVCDDSMCMPPASLELAAGR